MFSTRNPNNRKSSKSQSRREHSMQIEALDSRELLTVSPLFPDVSDGVPALVAPLEAAENVAPKHEFIADLTVIEKIDQTPANAVEEYMYFHYDSESGGY